MTDIVEMLRTSDAWALSNATSVMHEAANEIERLRENIEILDKLWHDYHDVYVLQVEENDRLREQVLLLEATGAEASDEIDRLRAQAMRAAAAWEKRTGDWFTATAERDRLREALLQISTGNIPAEYANTSSGYRRFAAAIIGEAAHD